MQFEYLPIKRMSRNLENETAELQNFLNEYAKEGWWLNEVLQETEVNGMRCQTFIFERPKYGQFDE